MAKINYVKAKKQHKDKDSATLKTKGNKGAGNRNRGKK